MIFVTVGTHEQPFNRLVQFVDILKKNRLIKENVIIQTGYSTYKPEYCEWQNFYTYQDMVRYVFTARIVITHGGPSSFIMPLQVGKIPIVVPRQKEFNEHINDHQVNFCREVAKRQKNIIEVEDIKQLGKIIEKYELIISEMLVTQHSNNENFCDGISLLVKELFKK